MKSLAAIRYSKDNPQEFGLESTGSPGPHRSMRTSLLANAVRISPQLFPALARAVDATLERLDADINIEAFVISDPHPNAQCVQHGGDFDAAVILTSGLVDLLSEEELPAVVGHEVGHHLFSHTGYPAPNDQMEDAERLRVLALRRAAEISADRMGLLCSESLDGALRAMLKVASGLSGRHVRMDLDAYLAQMRELESLSGDNSAVYDTHPMFPLRVRALLWFSMSEPYYYWKNQEGRAPISAERLNEQVADDFAAVSGFGLDHLQSAALRSVKIWSIVKLAIVDGRLSKREQAMLASVLGRDEARRAVRFVAGCANAAPEAVADKLADALESAAEVPEKQRAELLEELERVASASGGSDEQRLRVLYEVASGLKIDRDIQIRPWAYGGD